MSRCSITVQGGQDVKITGGRGPQGPQGPAGGSTRSYVAGETFSTNRLVYAVNGQVFTCSSDQVDTIEQMIGLAVQSGSIGFPVEVQSLGYKMDGSWTWSGQGKLYCGASGQLTETPPASGAIVSVANIVSPTEIDIKIDNLIEVI
jgi:hypothetical protein